MQMSRRPIQLILALLATLTVSAGCVTEPAHIIHAVAQPPGWYHIHLPGIGGYRSIDRLLIRGLQEGGVDAEFEPYDWTENDPGLSALLATQRHKVEAKKVAEMIEQNVRDHPGSKLTLSAHSGGAGIIVWALEQTPADVIVDDIVLLSPALSPRYDLSAALKHVRGHVYVFYSPYDVAVLGVGTNMFGTIDGVKADASGKVGFARPDGADAKQYEKLVQVPYDSDWIRVGNIGDHIGTLSRPFGKAIVAPLLLTGKLPKLPTSEAFKTPATLPTGAPPAPPAQPTTTTAAAPTIQQ